MQTPLVSIVVACRNEEKYIADCVNGFLSGTVTDIEVIVVDSMSEDRSLEILKGIAARDARLRILSNPDRITPKAYNIGVRAARAPYWAIFGAHSIPAKDWVERNLAALEANPSAAAVGGVLETISDTFVGRAIAGVMSSVFGVGNVRFRVGGAPGYTDTVVFGVYRREVTGRYGLFDEIFATNQDDEYNLRLISNGERLYFDPSIQARYYARPTWRKALDQYWRYGRYKVDVFRKNGRIGGIRQLVPAAWVAFLVVSALFGIFVPVLNLLTAAVIATYLLLGVVFMFRTARQCGLSVILFLPVAASIHLAYGLGTWRGAFARRF